MKGRLVVLACAAASLAFASAAYATDDLLEFQSAVDALHEVDPTIDPPPSSWSGDFVVGGGGTLFGQNTAVSAHSGPFGEDPRGIWTLQPGAIFGARVTCLAVIGNLAAAGVIVTRGAFEGVEFVVLFRDSGVPGGAGDGVALVSFPAQSCGAFVAFAAGAPPLAHGNILVHDELAP